MTSTLATAAFVLLLAGGALTEKTILNVDLYYESLCGDSVRFITDQLAPAYEDLKDHLRINFIPYGKASHNFIDGQWSFDCQHGQSECDGNRAQACALHAINKYEAAENRQRLSVKLLSCVMSSRYPVTAVPRCGDTVGLSEETKREFASCRGSNKGNELLAEHGHKTQKLNPVLSFVPTIIINGENDPSTLRDFRGVVCRQIPQPEKPTVCKTS